MYTQYAIVFKANDKVYSLTTNLPRARYLINDMFGPEHYAVYIKEVPMSVHCTDYVGPYDANKVLC